MDAVVQQAARTAATGFGPEVVAQVDRLLLTGGAEGGRRFMDLGTAAAVASLIVAVIQLAVSVIAELRKGGGAPRPGDVERWVRLTIEAEFPATLPPARQEEIIARAVAAILQEQDRTL